MVVVIVVAVVIVAAQAVVVAEATIKVVEMVDITGTETDTNNSLKPPSGGFIFYRPLFESQKLSIVYINHPNSTMMITETFF